MKSRLVGIFKQAKNRVSDWSFRRANFLITIAFSKRVWD